MSQTIWEYLSLMRSQGVKCTLFLVICTLEDSKVMGKLSIVKKGNVAMLKTNVLLPYECRLLKSKVLN